MADVEEKSDLSAYDLDEQIGFLLRRASQRHLAIFAQCIPDLTPTQFAAMAKAQDLGPVSQADLGRATAMDGATLKGVVDRLAGRGLVELTPSAEDRRRIMVRLSPERERLFAMLPAPAHDISAETLAPLTADEKRKILTLLKKIG